MITYRLDTFLRDQLFSVGVPTLDTISLEGASKRFTISRRRVSGLKERLIGTLHGLGEAREEFWALRGVSLKVSAGETIGVIGPNGAGKSTLLQLVAGILIPDEGWVLVNGRVTSLLELGAGFSPDLTGRENIFLNASLHGVPGAVVSRKFDDIVSFAELERFIDSPVRNYSSGMYMRLGFAVAVHLDPEIILVDEAFAVGDENFQRKCLRKLRDFQKRGVTIVLVSHDLHLVEQLCQRACLLEQGSVVSTGHPSEVIAHYHELAGAGVGIPGARRWGTGEIEILGIEFLSARGEVTSTVRTRDAFTLRVHYRAKARVERPVFGLAFHEEHGAHLSGPNTKMSGFPIPSVAGEGALEYRIEHLPFLPGRYIVSATAYDEDLITAYDHRDRFAAFTVLEGGTSERFGMMELPASWTFAGGTREG
jgi:lipopolysaccharide transport system ATP-binding protein